MKGVRQIGDDILHRSPQPVDWSNPQHIKQLKQDIQILEANLRETGGVGIAANQCADIPSPLQVIIIGTNDKKNRELAVQRYPNQEIPYETVLVNPTIIAHGKDVYYPKTGEGCLSLAGSLRAKVKRYMQITVVYQDITAISHERVFKGFAAHVVQHECDHLKGLVYFQKIMNELDVEQLQEIVDCVSAVLDLSNNPAAIPSSLNPILIFDRNGNNKIVYDKEQLVTVLKKTATETLLGLITLLQSKIDSARRNHVSST